MHMVVMGGAVPWIAIRQYFARIGIGIGHDNGLLRRQPKLMRGRVFGPVSTIVLLMSRMQGTRQHRTRQSTTARMHEGKHKRHDRAQRGCALQKPANGSFSEHDITCVSPHAPCQCGKLSGVFCRLPLETPLMRIKAREAALRILPLIQRRTCHDRSRSGTRRTPGNRCIDTGGKYSTRGQRLLAGPRP